MRLTGLPFLCNEGRTVVLGRPNTNTAIAMLIAATASLACVSRVNIEVPDSIDQGWIVIEYHREDCPYDGASEFVVSGSGYACTSQEQRAGWFVWQLYKVDPDGTRVALSLEDRVHSQERSSISTTSSSGTRCQFTVDTFWYGKEEGASGRWTSVLAVEHPECQSELEGFPL